MGVTQTHEHLILDAMGHYPNYEYVIDDEDLVANEVQEFHKSRRQDDLRCDSG